MNNNAQYCPACGKAVAGKGVSAISHQIGSASSAVQSFAKKSLASAFEASANASSNRKVAIGGAIAAAVGSMLPCFETNPVISTTTQGIGALYSMYSGSSSSIAVQSEYSMFNIGSMGIALDTLNNLYQSEPFVFTAIYGSISLMTFIALVLLIFGAIKAIGSNGAKCSLLRVGGVFAVLAGIVAIVVCIGSAQYEIGTVAIPGLLVTLIGGLVTVVKAGNA